MLYLLIIGILATGVWITSQSFIMLMLIVLAPAIILLTVLMLVMISASASGNQAKKRHEARQNQVQPHKVTFSKKGVWEAGTYFDLNSSPVHLKSVEMTNNPAILHFETYTRSSKNSNQKDKIRILVPRGHLEEAKQLRQRYYNEVINTKTTYNPREPD